MKEAQNNSEKKKNLLLKACKKHNELLKNRRMTAIPAIDDHISRIRLKDQSGSLPWWRTQQITNTYDVTDSERSEHATKIADRERRL